MVLESTHDKEVKGTTKVGESFKHHLTVLLGH